MVNKNEETEKKQQVEEKDNCCQELNALKSQLIRVNADFDNFKKRVIKERSEWENFAKINVIEVFLPIIDDFERALSVGRKESKKDELAWLEGFEIIYKNLNKILNDLGIKAIDCSRDFDPNLHEALVQVDSSDHKTGQIVQVLNKGYTFKDKVIRHAKVSVAK